MTDTAEVDAKEVVSKLWLQSGMQTFKVTETEKEILGEQIRLAIEEAYTEGKDSMEDSINEESYSMGVEEGETNGKEAGDSQLCRFRDQLTSMFEAESNNLRQEIIERLVDFMEKIKDEAHDIERDLDD